VEVGVATGKDSASQMPPSSPSARAGGRQVLCACTVASVRLFQLSDDAGLDRFIASVNRLLGALDVSVQAFDLSAFSVDLRILELVAGDDEFQFQVPVEVAYDFVVEVVDEIQYARIEKLRAATPTCPGHLHPMAVWADEDNAGWRCPNP
jgi:hypothetical protein